MTIVLNGTTGITNDGGYTGDGISFADTTPANTLVTTTGGNVGIGTSSPTQKFDVAGTGNFSGLLIGASSASTDVNTANDSGSFSVRGSSTTIASMSFHRVNAYAINMGLGTDNVFRIGGWSASNNCLQLTGDGNLSVLGNLAFNSGYGSVATAYGCRAWVNFNGTGTVAIRASGNVSSITDNGTGDYTINFTTAMPNANYAPICTAGDTTGSDPSVLQVSTSTAQTTTAVRVRSLSFSSYGDKPVCTVAIFR
jgi:hypothetical protein